MSPKFLNMDKGIVAYKAVVFRINKKDFLMCHGARYITHFYCLAVETGFYSDVEECLPVDPASWVRFPAGAEVQTILNS